MSSFINTDLDKKIPTKFIGKHILFSSFWLIGILIFFFRYDIIVAERYFVNIELLQIGIPTLYFLLLIGSFFFMKWYYIIGFVFYPLLLIFWFIPKTILSVGKFYLFTSYISSIFSIFKNIKKFKLFIFNVFLFVCSSIILLAVDEIWVRWFAIIVASYFYISYVVGFLKKAFSPPELFGDFIEKSIEQFINEKDPKKSLVISAFIRQKGDEELELSERREKQIRRILLANYAIELVGNRLNSYRGRQAYLISWLFGLVLFLGISILFFWFLNFQLYFIDVSNFIYTGKTILFDFFYYTLKTIGFGSTDIITPVGVTARISEISSFLTIGIFLLVLVVSVILSLKQDKMNENVRLTSEMFKKENGTLLRFMQDEFGLEIKEAISDVEDIDNSFRNLKRFINRIF